MDKVPAQSVNGFAHVDTANFLLVVLAFVFVAGILGALTGETGSRSQKAIVCAFGGGVVGTVLYIIYSIYFTGTITPVQ